MTAVDGADGSPTPERGPLSLLARLPAVLRFIARPSTLMMLAGLTLLVLPTAWAVRNSGHLFIGSLGLALIFALEASIYFRIVVQTSYGEEDVNPPELMDLHTDLFAPAWRYIVALLPIVLGIFWFGEQAYSSIMVGVIAFTGDPLLILDYPGPTLVLGVGVLLWPLLTVIAAMSTSALDVLNPATWAHSIRILGVTYIVGAIAFYLVLVVEALALKPAAAWFVGEVDIPVITNGVVLFSLYLPMALRGRILGATVEPYLGNN